MGANPVTPQFEIEPPSGQPQFEIEPPAPNAGLAPAAGPAPVNVSTSEGPIAQGLTSFETQLANTPRNLWNTLKNLPAQTKADTALHAKVMSGEVPATEELWNALGRINPFVTTDKGTPNAHLDIGATAANLAPLALDLKGGGVAESPLGQATKSIAKAAPYVTPVAKALATGYAKKLLPWPEIQGAVRAVQGVDEVPVQPQATPPPVRYSTRQAAPPPQATPPPIRYSIKQIQEAAAKQVAPPPLRWSGQVPSEAPTPPAPESPSQVVKTARIGKTPAPPPPEVTAQLQPVPYAENSTRLAQHSYDPQTGTATFQFKRGDIHQYAGVPPRVWQEYSEMAQQTGSAGKAFETYFQGRYKPTAAYKVDVKPSAGSKVRQALGGNQ